MLLVFIRNREIVIVCNILKFRIEMVSSVEIERILGRSSHPLCILTMLSRAILKRPLKTICNKSFGLVVS